MRNAGGRGDGGGAAAALGLRGVFRQVRFRPRQRDELGHFESAGGRGFCAERLRGVLHLPGQEGRDDIGDRKSTRLNSSHSSISYAVFCLKKKTKKKKKIYT